MDISINGKPADITLETEKTLGDVLSGLEGWLEGSEHRISGLQIDGSPIDVDALTDVFTWEVANIKTVDIRILSWSELALDAFHHAQEELRVYGNAPFEDHCRIRKAWEEEAAAHFLAEQIPEIGEWIGKTLEGEGFTSEEMGHLIDERIRELTDPAEELKALGSLVMEVAKRLEDLPLDIQTGKDSKAAETVHLFSHITEKLFRILHLLTLAGLVLHDLSIDTLSMHDFIAGFGTSLKELVTAYEAKDVVLVGDLAEYELAPRLLKLYAAISNADY
ncbi:MAG: hypothetical protein LBU17_13430 [Treponema sp.]|jgi:hypothetical protein|nr:hypothetical protein [Treponema sp.]